MPPPTPHERMQQLLADLDNLADDLESICTSTPEYQLYGTSLQQPLPTWAAEVREAAALLRRVMY